RLRAHPARSRRALVATSGGTKTERRRAVVNRTGYKNHRRAGPHARLDGVALSGNVSLYRRSSVLAARCRRFVYFKAILPILLGGADPIGGETHRRKFYLDS